MKLRWSAVGLLLVALVCMAADRPPWRARRRPGVLPNRLAAGRVAVGDWPAEPASPPEVEPARLGEAIRSLCGFMRPSTRLTYARSMLAAARTYDVDPFLLGAMAYRESRCRPKKEELGGVGLTLLAPGMYRGRFKRRTYHYRVQVDGGWQERSVAFPRFAFTQHRMLRVESNLYFTAGLLSAWRDQEATVHRHFEQVPHRHFVSHWVWGDRVKSARAEDRTLSDRRRLLQYYGALAAAPPIDAMGLQLGSPLDGVPRVVSSGLGFSRGGRRTHRGVDVESEFGEPVRSIAGGRVIFAGIDLPGRHHNRILPLDEINDYPRRQLGRGGRYVCTLHSTAGGGSLRFCYMHLEEVQVKAGQQIERGALIGSVGRTGMRRSAPHLHLEAHADGKLLDPLELLRGHLIGQPEDPEPPRRRRPRRRRAKAEAAPAPAPAALPDAGVVAR